MTVFGLVDDDLLLIFIDGRDPDPAVHEDVGALRGGANLEDALAGGELAQW